MERSSKVFSMTTTEDIRLTFNGSVCDNKFSKMKKLILAMQAYLQTRADDQAILINQHLQGLGASLDRSIFDPHTAITGEFFITLYDLLNVLEPRSLTTWYCVDVLSNACKNCAARQVLTSNYQFIPCLAKLVGDHLTRDKRIRILKLLQDLTCGIKIMWQIPHLTHLMTILAKWVERPELEIVILSLGVLVNLCYKNVTAMYTLNRNIDLKKFIRTCLSLKGPIIEVYVCQIVIILESVSFYVPVEILPKLIDSTFKAITELYTQKDSTLMRQVIEFFVSSMNQNNPLRSYGSCNEKLEPILELIEPDSFNAKDTAPNEECVMLILQFIHFLIEQKTPSISYLYPRFISLALEWIESKTVSYQTLALLKTIAVTTDRSHNAILGTLYERLPAFLLLLKEETFQGHPDYSKRLGALLQLLKVMIQVDSIRTKVIQELHEDLISNIFVLLLKDASPRSSCEDNFNKDMVNLYIYGLSLISELVKWDSRWRESMNTLLANRQIHVVLAQAICDSSKDIKKIAIELSATSCSLEVSSALEKIQPLAAARFDTNNQTHSIDNNEHAFNLIPVGQNQRLDSLLDKIEGSIARNSGDSLSTSELMELYNYKLMHLAQDERVALSSLEAATRQCTHLRHKIARLSAEQNRLQQSEFHMMQKFEEVTKKNEESNLMLKDLQNKFEAENGRHKACQNQLKLKERALGECEGLLEETKNKLIEMNKAKTNVEEQLNKLQQVVARIEENGIRLQKNLQKKDEMLKKVEDNYSKQVKSLEKALKEETLKSEEIQAQLQLKSQILENITKMANSQI